MQYTVDRSAGATAPPATRRRADRLRLPIAVTAIAISGQLVMARVFERAAQLWDDRHDETGLDEAVTKMLWLAAGVAVAVAATTFFVGVFQDAQANVPDPIAPLP